MTNEPHLPTRPPRPNAETAEFWEGCANGRFLLPRCDECENVFWYPRLVCPLCGAHSVHFVEASGVGTLYSFSIVRTGAGPFREFAPYVLAMVRLDEGPIVMSNLVGADIDEIDVDMPVEVVFEPAGDGGERIFRFAPTRPPRDHDV